METNDQSNDELPISPERPIEDFDDDGLERRKFVERLCNALISPETKLSRGVVIGITGPWGSGKSSLLNLLHKYIISNDQYPDAVVVRFDPWLVSGRDNLVAQFFAELIGTLKESNLQDRAKALTRALASYGAHLAPLANLVQPGLGVVAKSGMERLEKELSREKGLQQERSDLHELLRDINRPIVVIIDELDRTEDAEIKSIAQLVRAVADFREISYLLAYDQERVTEALGGAGDKKRGQAYLEKIVQFQIPLPIAFDDELLGLLAVGLDKLAQAGAIPRDYSANDRFQDLHSLLIPELLSTPRDISRTIGIFQVLEAMVAREVDWVDLFGYCALISKAPGVVEKIRINPDLVCDIPQTTSAIILRMDRDKKDASELIENIVPEHERSPGVNKLLGFLFPCCSDTQSGAHSSNAIYRRERLLTVLRLNLLPGGFSMQQIEDVLRGDSHDLEVFFKEVLDSPRSSRFLDRLMDVFHEIKDKDEVSIWLSFSNVFRKPGPNWETKISPTQGYLRSLSKLFIDGVEGGNYSSEGAREIFQALLENGDVNLTSLILTTQLMAHGIYWKKRDDFPIFLSERETRDVIFDLSADYQEEHLKGDLVATLWNINPILMMVDNGKWDIACVNQLKEILGDDVAVIGFTLLMFGPSHSTDIETIKKIINIDFYESRIKAALNEPPIDGFDEGTTFALKRAIDELKRATDEKD